MSKEATTFMGKDNCPCCKKLLDCATDINGTAKPNPGDISVCIGCGVILVYSEDMALKEAQAMDIFKLPENLIVQIYKASELVKRFKIRSN